MVDLLSLGASIKMVAFTKRVVYAIHVVFTIGMGIAEGKVIAVGHHHVALRVCKLYAVLWLPASANINTSSCCMVFRQLATELGAGNSGGNGNVKTFGSRARGVVVGNKQLVGDELADGRRDAVTLVAHDDDALVG